MGYNNAGRCGADRMGGGFPDASCHGTFIQPPMTVNSHSGEAYGMREMVVLALERYMTHMAEVLLVLLGLVWLGRGV